MFWLPVVEEFEVAVVAVESVGKASAAAARSAKKRSNSDDVNDSWSPCPPGCNTTNKQLFDILLKKTTCNFLNLYVMIL